MQELEKYRQEIDKIDSELVHLLALRQKCAKEIGNVKRAHGKDIYVPEREEALLKKLELFVKEQEIPYIKIRAIYKEILSASVALQMQRPISYLGPEGTFTHQAAIQNFGTSIEMQAKRTIAEIFESVQRDICAYGVIPVENSSEGAVVSSLDLLAESDLKIVAQVLLPVEQCLIGLGDLSQVRKVLSKDIALAQCSEWLLHNLPSADLISVDSTAAAVEEAKKDSSVAAVASSVAAQMRDMPIIEKSIQNNQINMTRFLVIGKDTNLSQSVKDGKNSIIVSLKNEPGSLLNVLEPFYRRNINLVKIESRLARHGMWEYVFFIDFIGTWESENVRSAIEEVRKKCSSIKHLGSYPNI